MSGTSAGAAKRWRCPKCGQLHRKGAKCSKPGRAPMLTADEIRDRANAYQRKWRRLHPKQSAVIHKRWRDSLRIQALVAYSDMEPECACCGESELVFLVLDHIDNNGAIERRTNNHRGGTSQYASLKREGWPPGYRVLCWNCNAARTILGYCPHDMQGDLHEQHD